MSTPPSLQTLTHALLPLGLTPHPTFLTSILTPSSSSQRLPPLPALTATARLRLLNADITQPLILDPSKTPCLPANISDPSVVSRGLELGDTHMDIPLQVLGIDDLGRSRWEQIESLEMRRKGELERGREVVRVVDEDGDGGVGLGGDSTQAQQQAQQQRPSPKSNGPFKLLLQDIKGQTVYGMELKRVEKIGYAPAMYIGCKVLVEAGARVARGVMLLEPATTRVLGGKIEVLDKKWREGREKALRDAVGSGSGAGENDN